MRRTMIHWLGLTGILALLSYMAAVVFHPWRIRATTGWPRQSAICLPRPRRQGPCGIGWRRLTILAALYARPALLFCIAEACSIPSVPGRRLPVYGDELDFSRGLWDVFPRRWRERNCIFPGNHAHRGHGGGSAFVHCFAVLPDRCRMQGKNSERDWTMGRCSACYDAGWLHRNGHRAVAVLRYC